MLPDARLHIPEPLRYHGHVMPHNQPPRYSSKVRRRNIPVHIVFWLIVLGLLYVFYKAFA